MALVHFSKLNIFAFLAMMTQHLADTAIYLSDSGSSTNEASQSNIYAGYPQDYYKPQAYQKYTPPPENQIQSDVGSTQTLLSPDYETLDAKYTITQVAKPPQATRSSQDSKPYLYAVAKIIPASVNYAPQIGLGNVYEKIPKKYHYGYRVSNPYVGTEFGHSEVHDGQIAKGVYHVLLPDGRLQNVKYWAGPSGYHATITYDTKY